VSGTDDPLNQPAPLEGYSVFEQDRALVEEVGREGWRLGAGKLD
jgi:hypothetical protein